MSNNKHIISEQNQKLVYDIFIKNLYTKIDKDKHNQFLKDNRLTDNFINENKK